MSNYYVAKVFFILSILSIAGCTSTARMHSNAIVTSIKNGKCDWLEVNIKEMSKEASIYNEHKDKLAEYRNTCRMNKFKNRLADIAEEKRIKEKNARIAKERARIQDLHWMYIRDRAITVNNKYLVTVGNSVCTRAEIRHALSTTKVIDKGAIISVNGNNYQVIIYTTHYRLRTGYGFEPGSVYPDVRHTGPKWFTNNTIDYEFYTC